MRANRLSLLVVMLAAGPGIFSGYSIARTWTLDQLIEAGKTEWIWSDKKFSAEVMAGVIDFNDADSPPSLDKQTRAEYPKSAHFGVIDYEGDVVVGVVVDQRGKVVHARVVEDSGTDVGFEASAVTAARKSSWNPGGDDGENVMVFLLHTERFRAHFTRWDEPIKMIDKWHWKLEQDMDPSYASSTAVPGIDEFVAVTERPEKKKFAKLKYPESARRKAGRGQVTVKALVDENGKVREAIVTSDTGTRVGLEEAALQAVFDSEWKPATMNGEPVMCWAIYQARFSLWY